MNAFGILDSEIPSGIYTFSITRCEWYQLEIMEKSTHSISEEFTWQWSQL